VWCANRFLDDFNLLSLDWLSLLLRVILQGE
jgi:hypothetical protein